MAGSSKLIRKALSILTLVALLTGTVTGCGGKQAEAADENANTGVSGKVVIYTSMYEDVIEAIGKTLDKQFPNADIDFFYGGTGTLQAKIAAEMDSGKLGCDMMMVAEPSYSLELDEAGVLHKYLSPERENLSFEYDQEGSWYPVRVCNMVLAYNPDKYSKDEIPTSLYDFAYDTSAKGLISMSNPLTSGTAMAAVTSLRDKYGYEYFEALGKQGVMVESGSVALTKLETGECKVIMILEESILKKREEEDSKLEVIYPDDGTIVIPSTIMIVDKDWSANSNTETCEAVTDWFLSDAGQQNIVAAWMHSPRAGYEKFPFDAIQTSEIQANSMPVNWENCFREREEIRTKFEESVKIEK